MSFSDAPSSTGQPLCLNQEQLLLSREWMENRGVAGSPSLAPTVLSLRGPLNTGALEQTLNEIVRRHAALRARFYPAPEILAGQRAWLLHQFGNGVYLPGVYRQCVSSTADVPFCRVNATRLRADQAEAAFENLIREEAAKGFDFTSAPRLRALLFARGPEDHLLGIMVDHAVADAWSMRILRKELVALYDRCCGGVERVLADPGLSYPDYAERQNRELASPAFSTALAYWKQQWERYGSCRIGFDDLPFSRSTQQPAEGRFAAERIMVAPDLCTAIRTFARLSRVSLHMFFFAAYAAALQRNTGKPRLALWCHFANRALPEVQNTIGYFIHRHLIGLEFPEELSGSELLWQTRKALLDAYEHQHVPLAHVWQATNRWPRYADSRVLVDYYQADELWEDWHLTGGLRVRRVERPSSPMPRFSSLGLYVRDGREGMVLEVQYSQDLFPQSAVCNLLNDIQSVISHLLAHADNRVRDFSLPRYGLVERRSRMGEFVSLTVAESSGSPDADRV